MAEVGGAREKLLRQLDLRLGAGTLECWERGGTAGGAAKPAAFLSSKSSCQKGCCPHQRCVKFQSCTFDEIKFYIQLVIVQVCSFSIKSKVLQETSWYICHVAQGKGTGSFPSDPDRTAVLRTPTGPVRRRRGTISPWGLGGWVFSSGAGGRLVHLTEQPVLSQQLVESFNFLFLLSAAELKVLDLGGQLNIHLL